MRPSLFTGPQAGLPAAQCRQTSIGYQAVRLSEFLNVTNASEFSSVCIRGGFAVRDSRSFATSRRCSTACLPPCTFAPAAAELGCTSTEARSKASETTSANSSTGSGGVQAGGAGCAAPCAEPRHSFGRDRRSLRRRGAWRDPSPFAERDRCSIRTPREFADPRDIATPQLIANRQH
jgi:hypothetical protein